MCSFPSNSPCLRAPVVNKYPQITFVIWERFFTAGE